MYQRGACDGSGLPWQRAVSAPLAEPARSRLRRRRGVSRALGARTSARASRAALGKGHLDRVEVTRRLGSREHGARLLAQLPARIATGDVRQGEQSHLGVARQLGRLAGRAVRGLAARSDSSCVKVASWTSTSASWAASQRLSRRGVAGEDDLAPLARRPHDLLGRHPATVSPRCRRPKSSPGFTPSSAASRASKCPGRGSDQRIAERGRPVAHRHRGDQVAIALRPPPRARAR